MCLKMLIIRFSPSQLLLLIENVSLPTMLSFWHRPAECDEITEYAHKVFGPHFDVNAHVFSSEKQTKNKWQSFQGAAFCNLDSSKKWSGTISITL